MEEEQEQRGRAVQAGRYEASPGGLCWRSAEVSKCGEFRAFPAEGMIYFPFHFYMQPAGQQDSWNSYYLYFWIFQQ